MSGANSAGPWLPGVEAFLVMMAGREVDTTAVEEELTHGTVEVVTGEGPDGLRLFLDPFGRPRFFPSTFWVELAITASNCWVLRPKNMHKSRLFFIY